MEMSIENIPYSKVTKSPEAMETPEKKVGFFRKAMDKVFGFGRKKELKRMKAYLDGVDRDQLRNDARMLAWNLPQGDLRESLENHLTGSMYGSADIESNYHTVREFNALVAEAKRQLGGVPQPVQEAPIAPAATGQPHLRVVPPVDEFDEISSPELGIHVRVNRKSGEFETLPMREVA